MGSFANSVFSVLLGWIRTAVNEFWNILSSGEGGGMLAWIGENWKALTLILCLIGIVVDAIIYVIRWRPFQVWASFFRRIRGKGQEADAWMEEEQPPQPMPEAPRREHPRATPAQHTARAWVYPDGTARIAQDYEPPQGEVMAPQAGPVPATQEQYTTQDESYYHRFARPVQQPVQFGELGRSYRRPRAAKNLYVPQERPAAAPDLTGLEDYPQAPAAVYEPPVAEVVEAPEEQLPVEREDRRPANVLQRVANPLRGLGLRDDEDEMDYHYTPPAPAVDKHQAYHEPVYPPGWQPPAGSDTQQEVKHRWS